MYERKKRVHRHGVKKAHHGHRHRGQGVDPNSYGQRLWTAEARYGPLSGSGGGLRPEYAYDINNPYGTGNPLFNPYGASNPGGRRIVTPAEAHARRQGVAMYQQSPAFQRAVQVTAPTPFFVGQYHKAPKWYECAWLNQGVQRWTNDYGQPVFLYGCNKPTWGGDVAQLLIHHQNKYQVAASRIGILSGTHGDRRGNTLLNRPSYRQKDFYFEDVITSRELQSCVVNILTPYNLNQLRSCCDVLIFAWCYSSQFRELQGIGVVDAQTGRVCDARHVLTSD